MSQYDYDIVIIGSGLGGLVCGTILSREGYSVCILEKNRQLGGCLQTFSRDKVVFDSGVHYIGGLDEGQTLHQIFRYLGLMDKLKLERMDQNVFDKIVFLDDGKEYNYAQGYENFIAQLLIDFPDEETAIRTYCDKIKEICSRFPLYNLRVGAGYDEKAGVMQIDAKSYIESLTSNKRLQEVLAGNNSLYAGEAGKTPFYVHALVLNSYIESAWKCVDGGSQIAKHLCRNIREKGGVIRNYCEVKKIVETDGVVQHIELADGTKVTAKHFISNIHPAQTLQMTQSEMLRGAYRKRITGLENTLSCFLVNLVIKPGTLKYFKHNYYCHKTTGVWGGMHYTDDTWPLTYALFASASSRSPEYAEGLTLLSYMRYEEVQQWAHTFNIASQEAHRGDDYDAFKAAKAEKLIALAAKTFPNLRDCIQSYTSATPLSFRDYTGNGDGSLYGISRDYKDPIRTFISPRTKLPNLYFTGQNVVMHGILGVTVSALVTCSAFVGLENLIEKIKDAQD